MPETKEGMDVGYVAHLARIDLTPEETTLFQGQLDQVLHKGLFGAGELVFRGGFGIGHGGLGLTATRARAWTETRHASGAPPRRDLHLRAVWIASELDRQMRELGREPRPLWFWKKPIVVLELRSLTGCA